MTTEEFYELLLGFGEDWAVKSVTPRVAEDEVEIAMEYIGTAKPYDYAPQREWRHLSTLQYKSYITARLPRFETSEGKVETLCPPWAEKHQRHTILFERMVIELLLATGNQTRTAQLVNCKFDVVNSILHNATKRGMERRKEAPDEVIEHLSIDEKSFKKGHKYVTILSDPVIGRVLDVVENRTGEAVTKLIKKALTPQQREHVQSISMDMWKAFINTAAQQLPQAEVVHDRFHLIGYLNKAIDQVRRREVKSNEELKGARYPLLKNPENLTTDQQIQFDEIKRANFEVSRAWQARENFKEAINISTPQTRETLFEQWLQDVTESGIKEVVKVANMFSGHLKGVLNAMTSTLSNAIAERLNGKIQLLKSIGRGYRKFDNFRSAILFFHGKLDLFPLNCR